MQNNKGNVKYPDIQGQMRHAYYSAMFTEPHSLSTSLLLMLGCGSIESAAFLPTSVTEGPVLL